MCGTGSTRIVMRTGRKFREGLTNSFWS